MEAVSYSGWITLWKGIFILAVLVFAGMTVWVSIGGYHDIKKLFQRLKEDESGGDADSDA